MVHGGLPRQHSFGTTVYRYTKAALVRNYGLQVSNGINIVYTIAKCVVSERFIRDAYRRELSHAANLLEDTYYLHLLYLALDLGIRLRQIGYLRIAWRKRMGV